MIVISMHLMRSVTRIILVTAYNCDPSLKLTKAVLMRAHNVCFMQK